jgi:hypothetical protein
MKNNKKIPGPAPFQPKTKVTRPSVTPFNSNSIQRNCGAPGCEDPDCDDPRNHGIDGVWVMRGRTLYHRKVSQIKKGTGTSTGTRKYVNSSSTAYPLGVSMEYSGIRKRHKDKGGRGGHSEFRNYPLAKGQKADAGHIFGNQYGGLGNQNPAVFPQHPQTNRGNYYQGEPTRYLWRAHEVQIRATVQGCKKQRVTVGLRFAPRVKYGRYCKNCLLVYKAGEKVCKGCKQKLT